MKAKIYLQLPRLRKTTLTGYIGGDSKEICMFDENHRQTAELLRPELLNISKHGMLLRGFELNGHTRDGREKLRYQEWYCIFSDN